MRTQLFQDPKSKIDQNEIINKNYLRNKLIRLTYKFTKSVTKSSTKVRDLKTYNKVISDLIYGNRWHKNVNDEL